ncbi:MAG: ATP-binding protein, partial [Desulfobacterales bacterium]
MEPTELIEIISRGEDSRNQFKADVRNEVSLGQEMAAFSNSGGGRIYIGVSDDASVSGLSIADIGRLNQLISNAASQQ